MRCLVVPIFSAVLRIHCRVLQLESVQFPYHRVRQLSGWRVVVLEVELPILTD